MQLKQAAEQLRKAREKRDRLVAEARGEGATIYELADAAGYKTTSQIRRILKGSAVVVLLALVFVATPASAHRPPVKKYDVEARGVRRAHPPEQAWSAGWILYAWPQTNNERIWNFAGKMRSRRAARARRRARRTLRPLVRPRYRVTVRVSVIP